MSNRFLDALKNLTTKNVTDSDPEVKPEIAKKKEENGLFIGVYIDFTKTFFVVIDEKLGGDRKSLCESEISSFPRDFRNQKPSTSSAQVADRSNDYRLDARAIKKKVMAHIDRKYKGIKLKGIAIGYFGYRLEALENAIAEVWPEMIGENTFHCAPIADIYFDLIFKIEGKTNFSYLYNVVGVLYIGPSLWMITESDKKTSPTVRIRSPGTYLSENGSAYGIGKNILDYYFETLNLPENDLTKVKRDEITANLRKHFGCDSMFKIISLIEQEDMREMLATFAVELGKSAKNAIRQNFGPHNEIVKAFSDAGQFIRKHFLNDLEIFGFSWSRPPLFKIVLCGEIAQCHTLFNFKRKNEIANPSSIWETDACLDSPAMAAGFLAFKKYRNAPPVILGHDLC